MKKKMTDKHKLMSYILSTDADLNRVKNITQKEIGDLFGVSQPTVAQGIKEARLRIEIDQLGKELSRAKSEVLKLRGIEALGLPEHIDPQYKRKP